MLPSIEQERARLQALGLADTDLPFFTHQPDFRTGLLLLHGSAATPCNHRALGQSLFGWGYTVYAPLLAGHEDLSHLHSGAVSWTDCYRSAETALNQLLSVVEQVFVIGSSFGGSLAYILGVEQASRIAGVIAISAPAQSSERWLPHEPWPRQVREAIVAADARLQHLRLPTLIMHGSDDPSVKVRHGLYAYEQIPALRKKLVLYDGIGHSLGFGYNTPEVAEDIHQFINSTYPSRHIRFGLPDRGYHSVALAGEFNGWSSQSMPMQRHGESWNIDISLLPGAYQYKLVIDGHDWILDPAAESVPTPHGAPNSLIRVG